MTEPKLYDYYFIRYKTEDVCSSFVFRCDAGFSPIDAYGEVRKNILEEFKGVHITAFNFIKTGP